MTEQPKFLLYQEQGKTKLLVRCPKCKRTVEIFDPAKYIFRNLRGNQGLAVIRCESCKSTSFVGICVGCLEIVAKSLRWSDPF